MPQKSLIFADPITSIKGVGESTAEKLLRLKISTVGDFVRFLPNRYLDFSQKTKIKDLKDNSSVCFIGTLNNIKSFYTKTGKLLTEAKIQDETGKVGLLWFHNPYIQRSLQEGQEYTVAGKVSVFNNKLVLVSPTVEEGNSLSINTNGLVPIFPQTKGITSKWIRQKLFSILDDLNLPEVLEEEDICQQKLLPITTAYKQIHFPNSKQEKKEADKRLSFNQHLQISLNNLLEQKQNGDSPSIKINPEIDLEGKNKLPFTLTPDQQKAIKSIYKDLSSTEYTHRLIQGDTGSGKTATLIMAANQCLSQNQSCALLAPTQILANQHFDNFKKLLLFPEKVVLVTGQSESPPTDKPFIYIGTHALINKLPKKLKHPLVFLAIDEQHKFGVKQREELRDRIPVPHLLNLSATPIPRTVALGLLGDIHTSTIKYKPQNRLPIKTHIVSQSYFQKSANWLNNQIKNGEQIYVVSPNIFETDENSEVASIESLLQKYKKILPSTPIFVIHGKVKSQNQSQILKSFKNTPGSILIATSLIEVGIDIPSASIMIIHSAERFGLAQLHQLRGRVGRGEKQSYCFLVPSTDDQVETERLKLLQKYDSGLLLAKKDLVLRGAGEVFGEKQHGQLQTKLKYFWSKKSFLAAKKYAKKLLQENAKNAAIIATKLGTC